MNLESYVIHIIQIKSVSTVYFLFSDVTITSRNKKYFTKFVKAFSSRLKYNVIVTRITMLAARNRGRNDTVI